VLVRLRLWSDIVQVQTPSRLHGRVSEKLGRIGMDADAELEDEAVFEDPTEFGRDGGRHEGELDLFVSRGCVSEMKRLRSGEGER
jgi:hypothetical protein